MKKKEYTVTIKYLIEGASDTFSETLTGATAEAVIAQANMGHDLDFMVDAEGVYTHYIIPWSSVIALEAAYEMADVLPAQDGICSETNSILVYCQEKTRPKGSDLPSAEDFLDYVYDERGNDITEDYESYTIVATGIPANSNTPGEYPVTITVTVGENSGSCETTLTITEE